jgi:hypothetical protein
VRPLGKDRRFVNLVLRKPSRHGDQASRQRDPDRRGGAASWSRLAGCNELQESPERLLGIVRLDFATHDLYERPTIRPCSSMSMCSAAGFDGSPGIVRMSPQIG